MHNIGVYIGYVLLCQMRVYGRLNGARRRRNVAITEASPMQTYVKYGGANRRIAPSPPLATL